MGNVSVDMSGLTALESELEHVAEQERDVREAARAGAERAVKAHRVPTRSGELRDTGYARLGSEIEVGYTSPHMGRTAQRDLVLRGLADEAAEAAAVDGEKKIGEIVGKL